MAEKLVSGIIDRNKKGFGFLIPFDTNLEDIYISKKTMINIFDGDTVQVLIKKKKYGGFSDRGDIIKVIKRANKFILGKVFKEKNIFYLIPLNEKICLPLPISKNNTNKDLKNLQNKIVKCEITNSKNSMQGISPKCIIIKILGDIKSKHFEEEIIFSEFNFKEGFPKSVKKELNKIQTTLTQEDFRGRGNFRNLLTITIDPERAKDFDDAISLEVNPDKFTLYVHIADVGHYVKLGSKIDAEAYDRGTSVYLIDKVIPMLPEKLSNGLCSLQANKDRLTVSVKAEFDNTGKLLKYKFYESVINVNKRFAYKEVDEIIDSDYDVDYPENILKMIKQMVELSQKFRKERIKNGSIDFDLPEPVFTLDRKGKVTNTILENRTLSHELIEEFMLKANEITAEHLSKLKLQILYRTHETPDALKISKLANIFSNYGFRLKKINFVDPGEIQNVIDKIKDKEEERFLTTLILRSMKQARYTKDNIGHYGLAKQFYTHFTSPIRRYPDLIVHRTLKDLLNGRIKKYKKNTYGAELEKKGQELSKLERIAVDAERKSIRLRLMQYVKGKKGQIFEAYITGVISSGIFAELDNTLEGFISLDGLSEDYVLDVDNYELRTKNRTYKLGQKIKVKVLEVDIINYKVDFKMIEE